MATAGWSLRTSGTVLALAGSMLCGQVTAPATPPKHDLTQVSLEDLLEIEVTSVSKKEQKLSAAGAAVFVITQDDIRRSGANNIPDLLRMAPGVDVARIDGNSWAISIRGFNSLYANKVLVLIDGRSVYNSTFSGTVWSQEQVPLENIERIEVIRGPGGTVWGANAVNGVINIITKSAQATKGNLVVMGGGSETFGDGLFQYGAAAGEKGAYRVFGRAFKTADSGFTAGERVGDHAHMLQAGFRSDWQLTLRDSLSVQGGLVQTKAGEDFLALGSLTPAQGVLHDLAHDDSGNVLGRWDRTLKDGSGISVTAYVDRESRVVQNFGESRTTTDFEFNHHWKTGARNDLVWGLGYRVSSDHLRASPLVDVKPAHRTDQLLNAFIQDEIRIGTRITLSIGSKFESNSYTGFEIEPSVQLVWSASPRHTVWASAGRAVREPSRVDFGVQSEYGAIPFGNSIAILRVYGNPHLKAEAVRDFEAGYRAQANKRLSFDLTAFLSYYDHLQTSEPGTPFFENLGGEPQLIIPITLNYLAHARNYGGEAFANWVVSNRWKVGAGYSLLHVNIKHDAASQDSAVDASSRNDPKQHFQIRSSLTPQPRWDWDASMTYAGPRVALGVPASARVDTRVAFRINERIELSVSGNNLLRPRHAEFSDQYGLLHSLVERSVFAKATCRF